MSENMHNHSGRECHDQPRQIYQNQHVLQLVRIGNHMLHLRVSTFFLIKSFF